MEGRIWLINRNGSADLHTPIHTHPWDGKVDDIVLTSKIRSWGVQNLVVFINFPV